MLESNASASFQRCHLSLQVEEGVGQLVKAEKSQRQSRMIMCIMFLVVAVIVMLLFVILQNLFF